MRWISVETASLMLRLHNESKREAAQRAELTCSAGDLARSHPKRPWIQIYDPSIHEEVVMVPVQKEPLLEKIQDWMGDHWLCSTMLVSAAMVVILFLFVHLFVLN